jgi:hypothetical protein
MYETRRDPPQTFVNFILTISRRYPGRLLKTTKSVNSWLDNCPIGAQTPSDEVGGLLCCAAGELVRQSGTTKKTAPAKREEGFG